MTKSIILPALAAALLLAAAGQPAAAQAVKPLSPQPADAQLSPGLAVCYIYGFIRHIREMVEWEGHKDCKAGKPLKRLNSRAGKDLVLTSDNDDGVMALITGLIHFEKTGSYAFAFESNDGVRLEIDGHMVVEDPDVHGDRFSDIGTIDVGEPGWYPLTVRYFERKNTSTLRFYWQPPGHDGTMPLVPKQALAHIAAE